jgi:hypothetical protein
VLEVKDEILNPGSEETKLSGLRFGLGRLMNALPAFLLAAAYAVTGLGRRPILGFDGTTLAQLLLVEFIAVFFGMFILAMIIAWGKAQGRKRIEISALLSITIFIAVGLSFTVGPWGPLLLAMGTLGTYWSPYRRWYTNAVISNSVVRGFISLALYLFWVFLAYRPPDGGAMWQDAKYTHLAGLMYFFCIGVLEWSGDMDG